MRSAFVVTAVVASFATASCSAGCVQRPMQRVPSPDGQWVAVVYATACGPTTATLVHVSVLPASETELPSTGNVFIGDSDMGTARLTKEGYPWAAASWTGPTELLVRYADRGRVAKKERKRGDVVVRYAIEK